VLVHRANRLLSESTRMLCALRSSEVEGERRQREESSACGYSSALKRSFIRQQFLRF
jgi:hypothetical protein